MKTVWVERLLVVGCVLFSWWSWVRSQEADRQRIIATENAYAAGDTIRLLRDKRATDSAGYAVSLQQRDVRLSGMAERLAKSERLNARLRADLAVAGRAVDTILVGAAPPVVGDLGRLVDSVQVQGPPITGTITADLAPWRPTTWGIRLKPDEIPLTVVVGCRKGLPPEILVTGPDWATVRPSGTLSPEICHPKSRRGWLMPLLIGVGLGVVTWEGLR